MIQSTCKKILKSIASVLWSLNFFGDHMLNSIFSMGISIGIPVESLTEDVQSRFSHTVQYKNRILEGLM